MEAGGSGFNRAYEMIMLFKWFRITPVFSPQHVTYDLLSTLFWLAVHGKPVLFWKGTSGLKFPCILFMHANGTGPFEFRAVPIL